MGVLAQSDEVDGVWSIEARDMTGDGRDDLLLRAYAHNGTVIDRMTVQVMVFDREHNELRSVFRDVTDVKEDVLLRRTNDSIQLAQYEMHCSVELVVAGGQTEIVMTRISQTCTHGGQAVEPPAAISRELVRRCRWNQAEQLFEASVIRNGRSSWVRGDLSRLLDGESDSGGPEAR